MQIREDVGKQVSNALQRTADAESATSAAREQCAESVAAAETAVVTANLQVAAAHAAQTDAVRLQGHLQASKQRLQAEHDVATAVREEDLEGPGAVVRSCHRMQSPYSNQITISRRRSYPPRLKQQMRSSEGEIWQNK